MIPLLNTKFICIVNSESQDLAAVISSYLSNSGEYLPMFEFGSVLCNKSENPTSKSQFAISHTRALEFNIKIYNALQHLSKEPIIILAGLDTNQISYLDFLNDLESIISIDDNDSVDINLHSFTTKQGVVYSTKDNLLIGLYNAFQQNSLLQIRETAEPLNIVYNQGKGLVVIERDEVSSTVIAVNFANSINANIEIIDKPEVSQKEVISLIELWCKEKKDNYLYDLSVQVYPYIEHITFAKYEFATFFTYGVPYSLIMKNCIPITHVNITLRPDFFLFNTILKEYKQSVHSAIVFSPREFGINEETDFVVELLKKGKYYVRLLVDEDATVANIDNHVNDFPFEILHLCSHGGRVDGYTTIGNFFDRDGNEHIIEYDEIVSFAPEYGQEKIGVTSKYIWRKFNGFDWKSQELKNQNYPHHVFESMLENMDNFRSQKKQRKLDIVDSCGIICKHSFYQAMIQTIAGHHENPLIFNNTCWSWLNISDFFLSEGVSGYIGTLWAVNNEVAKNVAETFYANIFNGTVLDAMQIALGQAKDTEDENNYAFWGVHFSQIKRGDYIAASKLKIFLKLKSSYSFWINRLKFVKDARTREIIEKKIAWIRREMVIIVKV